MRILLSFTIISFLLLSVGYTEQIGVYDGMLNKVSDSQHMMQNGKVCSDQNYKNDSEMERYICIYRSGAIREKNYCKKFFDPNKGYIVLMKKAASAFGIPFPVIACVGLVESGIYFDPSDQDDYRGVGQFGVAAVETLTGKFESHAYKEMWKAYSNRSIRQFTVDNIMNKEDPEIVVGAIATFIKDLFSEISCDECGSDDAPGWKKIFIMVGGYNSSPKKVSLWATKSESELLGKNHFKRETKNYIEAMKRCLQPNHYTSFRSDVAGSGVSREFVEQNENCPMEKCNK